MLFRSLLAPYPARPIAPLAGVPLFVRALRAADEAAAIDAGLAAPLEELRISRALRELLARCVWTRGGLAFASAEALGNLPAARLQALASEALDALARISPTYARSKWEAWHRRLELGAQHPSNFHDAAAVASCVDMIPAGWGGGGGFTARPDRYWGLPVGELLDGHWMVWSAARAVIGKRRK
jgi:hypothetical protein